MADPTPEQLERIRARAARVAMFFAARSERTSGRHALTEQFPATLPGLPPVSGDDLDAAGLRRIAEAVRRAGATVERMSSEPRPAHGPDDTNATSRAGGPLCGVPLLPGGGYCPEPWDHDLDGTAHGAVPSSSTACGRFVPGSESGELCLRWYGHPGECSPTAVDPRVVAPVADVLATARMASRAGGSPVGDLLYGPEGLPLPDDEVLSYTPEILRRLDDVLRHQVSELETVGATAHDARHRARSAVASLDDLARQGLITAEAVDRGEEELEQLRSRLDAQAPNQTVATLVRTCRAAAWTAVGLYVLALAALVLVVAGN